MLLLALFLHKTEGNLKAENINVIALIVFLVDQHTIQCSHIIEYPPCNLKNGKNKSLRGCVSAPGVI